MKQFLLFYLYFFCRVQFLLLMCFMSNISFCLNLFICCEKYPNRILCPSYIVKLVVKQFAKWLFLKNILACPLHLFIYTFFIENINSVFVKYCILSNFMLSLYNYSLKHQWLRIYDRIAFSVSMLPLYIYRFKR